VTVVPATAGPGVLPQADCAGSRNRRDFNSLESPRRSPACSIRWIAVPIGRFKYASLVPDERPLPMGHDLDIF